MVHLPKWNELHVSNVQLWFDETAQHMVCDKLQRELWAVMVPLFYVVFFFFIRFLHINDCIRQ